MVLQTMNFPLTYIFFGIFSGDFVNTHGLQLGDFIIVYQDNQNQNYVCCACHIKDLWDSEILSFSRWLTQVLCRYFFRSFRLKRLLIKMYTLISQVIQSMTSSSMTMKLTGPAPSMWIIRWPRTPACPLFMTPQPSQMTLHWIFWVVHWQVIQGLDLSRKALDLSRTYLLMTSTNT